MYNVRYDIILVLGLDNRNIDNCYRYSTFSDNRYTDQISICTYVHVHSVQGIKKHPSNLTYNWFYIWYMIPKLSIFMPISGRSFLSSN